MGKLPRILRTVCRHTRFMVYHFDRLVDYRIHHHYGSNIVKYIASLHSGPRQRMISCSSHPVRFPPSSSHWISALTPNISIFWSSYLISATSWLDSSVVIIACILLSVPRTSCRSLTESWALGSLQEVDEIESPAESPPREEYACS